MKKFPLASILIASHNRADYISEAIESVLNQRYDNFELFIIDDYSTDNSWEIIQSYVKKNSKIRALKNVKNEGVGYTKKKLLDEAKGEILFILDADDAIAEDAIYASVTKHIEDKDVSLVYTNHFICDENLNSTNKKSISKKIPKGETHLSFHGIGHLVSVKKEFYKKIEGLNPNLSIAVDQDFYYQMEEVGKVYFLNKKLYFYRHNRYSISLNKNKFKAAKQKVQLMKSAKDRRIKKKLNLKNPTDNELYLLNWYADNQLGRGNIIKASLLAMTQGNFKIISFIIKFHLKNLFFGYI